jgi:hypothetical protein
MAQTNIKQPRYLSTTHFLVATSIDFDGDGPELAYVQVVGVYESLEDAKKSVDANAGLIMDNDKQALTIYKVNLDECKVHDFHRKDLKESVKRALKEQREADDAHLRAAYSTLDGPAPGTGQQHVFKTERPTTFGGKITKGNFPRPDPVLQGVLPDTAPLQPTFIKPKTNTISF